MLRNNPLRSTTKVNPHVLQLSDRPVQPQPTLKAQNLSRLPVQRRTVDLNVIDIDTNTHYILIHGRLLITHLAHNKFEVSTTASLTSDHRENTA